LLLTAGLPWSTILYTILLDEIMIVTGLVGALVASSYKWGYFVFATVALFGIAYNVTWVGRMHANSKGDAVRNTYLKCGVWTICLWFIYPIAWGLCEGGNVISPDSEAIFYSVLDVLAKPVFGALLLYGHRDIDPEFIGVRIGDYDPPRAQRGEEANNRINNDAHSEIINGAQPNGQVPNPSNNVIPQGALPTGRSSRESATARVSKEENVGNGNGPSFSA
jgi:bacteriorhodopsin